VTLKTIEGVGKVDVANLVIKYSVENASWKPLYEIKVAPGADTCQVCRRWLQVWRIHGFLLYIWLSLLHQQQFFFRFLQFYSRNTNDRSLKKFLWVYQRRRCKMFQADEELSKHLSFALHPKLGFLTFCPTKLGSTIRASVRFRPKNLPLAAVEEFCAANGLSIRGEKTCRICRTNFLTIFLDEFNYNLLILSIYVW